MGNEQTHHAQARQVAREVAAADRFESLLNALPAGVIVLDGSGRIQESNPAARELLGVPLSGEPWRDIAERVFMPARGEELPLRNGRWVSLSTCPVGSAPGQILLLHDVTENHRLQERLEHSRRLMDMGRMAASLAHQIRTPLATALLYASHLQREELPPSKRTAFAEKLTGRLRHLEQLVTDMLVFARGGEAQSSVLAVEAFIEAVRAAAVETGKPRGVDAVLEGEIPEGASIYGSRTLLMTLFQNLVANAVEVTETGGRIVLAARLDGARLKLSVHDEGPGIPPEMQERIFEPFVTTRSGGTGLGLAVVRAVAHTHGGEVFVTSREGEGSVFTVSLPLALSESESNA